MSQFILLYLLFYRPLNKSPAMFWPTSNVMGKASPEGAMSFQLRNDLISIQSLKYLRLLHTREKVLRIGPAFFLKWSLNSSGTLDTNGDTVKPSNCSTGRAAQNARGSTFEDLSGTICVVCKLGQYCVPCRNPSSLCRIGRNVLTVHPCEVRLKAKSRWISTAARIHVHPVRHKEKELRLRTIA